MLDTVKYESYSFILIVMHSMRVGVGRGVKFILFLINVSTRPLPHFLSHLTMLYPGIKKFFHF